MEILWAGETIGIVSMVAGSIIAIWIALHFFVNRDLNQPPATTTGPREPEPPARSGRP